MNKVEFKNVFLRYEGAGDYSLSDISFEAKPGETIGIIGSTGSGKSSLVYLIPGFYEAAQGTVLVDGEDVKTMDKKELLKKIGFCFQQYYLFRGTIRDNISFGAGNVSDKDLEEAMKIAQAYEFVSKKPLGLDEPVSEKGTNLSGGQKQRLMITRALAKKPEILILDDSSSALDYATDKKLREALKTLDNMTVFVVSQRTAAVCHADRIIVLEDGHMVGIGTHEELLKSNEVYKEIYESQTRQ